jgi:aryl-alcohol dehydrogenase-like predicted oxidoreductase
MADRDEIVLATKVHGAMREGPNGGGLSRKAIMAEIDASLRRLGTDYVDLYQIHRWDYETPIEETLEALDDIVRAGKARYIGASSMFAWQFAKALSISEQRGWAASSRCRTTTTCSTARRSGRCCRSARARTSP